MQTLLGVSIGLMACPGCNLDDVSLEAAGDGLEERLAARRVQRRYLSITRNKDLQWRPLRLVCHSLASWIYLKTSEKTEYVLPYRIRVQSVPRARRIILLDLRGDSFRGHKHRCTRNVRPRSGTYPSPWITGCTAVFFWTLINGTAASAALEDLSGPWVWAAIPFMARLCCSFACFDYNGFR